MGAETDDVLACLMVWFIAARSSSAESLYASASWLGVPPSAWEIADAALVAAEDVPGPRGIDAAFGIAIASVERRAALESARERVLEVAKLWVDGLATTEAIFKAVGALRDVEALLRMITRYRRQIPAADLPESQRHLLVKRTEATHAR